MGVYFSQCYHQQPHKPTHILTSTLPASLSIVQLCYSNCSVFFTKKYVIIFNSEKTPVINETRNTYDVLWNVTIETSQPNPLLTADITKQENSFLSLDKTKSELDSYLHAATGCPTKSTFIQAINNRNFITCSCLT